MAWIALFAGRSLEAIRQQLSAKNYRVGQARKAARSGDWSLAARWYEKSLRTSADVASVWVQYGHALKERGDLQGAARAYRISVQLVPAPETLVHLGHVLLRNSRSSEAARAFFRALTINADFFPAHDGLIAAGVSPDEISLAFERGTLPAATEESTSRLGAPAEEQQFEPPDGLVRLPSLGHTPVRNGGGLDSTVAKHLAGSGGEYPSFCIVALNQQRLVGWAFLPLDFHQTALVNVYQRGRFIACGLANRTRPVESTLGPAYNWFEILWSDWSVTPERGQMARLVLQRGEDGRICRNADNGAGPLICEMHELAEAELFDEGAAVLAPSRLHHLPAASIVQLYYLDYLGRAADANSLGRYVSALERRATTIDDFRYELLRSAEFRRRQIRAHHRLGRVAMVQSLSVYERVPFERRPPLKQYEEISADEFMSDDHARFLQTCYSRILLRSLDRHGRRDLLPSLEERRISRLDVLREIVLQAAANGRLVQVQNLQHLGDWSGRTASPQRTEGAVL